MSDLHPPDHEARRPVVLLLHAFPLDRRLWAPVVPLLSETARVLAPDLAGFGAESPAPGGTTTMEHMAQEVARICEAPGDRPDLVAGVSMGGYVALALAALRPELVPRLVLADSRARADTDLERAGRDALIDALGAAGDRAHDLLARTMMPRLLAASAAVETVHAIRALLDLAPLAGVAGALRGMAARADRTAIVERFPGPFVGCCGAEDAAPTPDEMRALTARAPRGRFVVIEGAGHLSPVEKPQAFARLVIDALGEPA